MAIAASIIAVIALVLVIADFGTPSASAVVSQTVTWDGNGTSNGQCSTFKSDPDLNPGPGQQAWLFILTQPDASPWDLTATFSPDGVVNGTVISATGSVHIVVYTTAGATLQSASVTGGSSNSNLTVSHCELGATATPHVTITKSDDTGGTVAADGTFNWTITVHVADATTTASVTVTDTIPTGFSVTYPLNPPGFDCSASSGNSISCVLAAGKTIGDYTITIPVTAPHAVPSNNCTLYTNTANATGTNVSDGSDSDSVTVTCPAPGSITIVKDSGNTDGTFNFTSDIPGHTSFQITTNGGTGQIGPWTVDPQHYAIDEVSAGRLGPGFRHL